MILHAAANALAYEILLKVDIVVECAERCESAGHRFRRKLGAVAIPRLPATVLTRRSGLIAGVIAITGG